MVRCRHKVFSDDFKEIIIVEKKLPIGIQSLERSGQIIFCMLIKQRTFINWSTIMCLIS